MHDGMQYDPIRGQGQGHESMHESRKFDNFQGLSPHGK